MPASSLPSWQRPMSAGPPLDEGARAAESAWPGLAWPHEGLSEPGPAPFPAEGRGATAPAHEPGDGGNGEPGFPPGTAWWAVPGALVGIVLAGLGASVGYALTDSKTSAASDLLGEAGLWVAMLGTAVFVSRRFGTGSLARDYHLAIRPKDLVWGVIAVIGALIVVQGVLGAFAGTKFAGSNDEILTQQKGNSAGLVIVALLVALGAPFFEELFFRGFLRTALQRRFGGHGAVWLQAVFFGMAHFGEAANSAGNVSVVLAMFGVGVVLGYAAKLTGRLGAGMIAHCLFNLLAVALVL